MASALGYRFLDGAGNEIEPVGAALPQLDRIDASHVHPGLASVSVTGACDVDNPLTGPSGASATYGPQKGASPDDVLFLDRALGHLAAVVNRDLGVGWKDEPGAGAAGGLGFGLLAFCGAHLRPGVEVVMDAVGLARRIASADLVITGEGSFDRGSLHGKVPAGILRACALAGVPVAIVCGRAEIEPERRAHRLAGGTGRGTPSAPRSPVLAGDRRRGPRGAGLRARRGAAVSGAIDRFTEAARALGLHPEVRRFPEGTKTAQDAARAIGVEVGQIVKSLIFMADGRPVLALTSGSNRVDEGRLAELTPPTGSVARRRRRREPRPGSPLAAPLRSATRTA